MLTVVTLGGLVAGFSVSHIGLSAIREPLIAGSGAAAESLGLVGRGWKLPKVWLADSNGLEVWPDAATAGRQIYRAGYTAVASALLFPALLAYPSVREAAAAAPSALTPERWWAAFAVASAAQGASLASLAQPSPLSLVPAFEGDPGAPLGVRRDDGAKLAPSGLTRITRHPLILPVVPWGAANALLAGGRGADLALFLGLAVYAVAGCAAQDARVEASAQVGTTFKDAALDDFYASTSFVPFGACVDGRQSLAAAVAEVPPAAAVAGLAVGAAVEWVTLTSWLGLAPPG